MITALPTRQALTTAKTIWQHRSLRSLLQRTMSAQTSGTATPAEADDPSRRKLKILMLHGYTQSGPLFHAKTRALEKQLTKAFPAAPSPPPTTTTSRVKPQPALHHPLYPGGIQLVYPTAPIRLLPADIPGFQPSELEGADPKEESDAWGWWKRETGSGLYKGLDQGLDVIADTIVAHEGIDAVVGFSQGAAAAAMVAALLEPVRKAMQINSDGSSNSSSSTPSWSASWSRVRALHPQGLRFCVSYSGFYAPHSAYEGFYEPHIKTPTLHYIGSLDSVVEESRSMGLVERCDVGTRRVVVHPGGHFVPIGKEMVGVLVGFMRECLAGEKEEEESVEDMDVPF